MKSILVLLLPLKLLLSQDLEAKEYDVCVYGAIGLQSESSVG